MSSAEASMRLSAFAVYKNLVPGLKAYEDHNSAAAATNGTARKKQKKQNDVKPMTIKLEDKKPTGGLVNGDHAKSKSKSQKNAHSAYPALQLHKRGQPPLGPKVKPTPSPIVKSPPVFAPRMMDDSSKKKKKPKPKIMLPRVAVSAPIPTNVIDFITSKAAELEKEKLDKPWKKRRVVEDPAEESVAQIAAGPSAPLHGEVVENGVTEELEDDLPKKRKSKKKKNKSEKLAAAKGIEGDDVTIIEDEVAAQVQEEEETVAPPPEKSSKMAKKLEAKRRLKNGHAEPTESSSSCADDRSATSTFKWLIHPKTVPEFFSNFWEKKPLLVKRTSPDYYGDLLTSAKLDKMLRENIVRFGKNIDVTSYENGIRETHNPTGRAMPPVVWDYYNNGCSIRLLNPQTYINSVWKLNSSLQDFVGTFVGANVYLTPPKSQGFAPHWDDIEAFVLQLEGSKRWRVYEPLEKLPKASSENLKEDIIGEPILDVVLKPGDLLYFPRGYIHQANAMKEHSLHITLSCYQNNSYADFLKEYLPMALDHATMSSVAHREGLPRDYLSFMGVAHADRKGKEVTAKRAAFIKKIKELTAAIIDDPMIDFAADQMGKKVIWDCLPPYLDKSEMRATVSSDVNYTFANGAVEISNELDLTNEVRILRSNAVRLVIEDASLRLYYSTENSMEYHGEEAQFIETVEEAGPAIEFLISAFPAYTKIKDLPGDDEGLKLQIISDLWDKGILRTKV